MKITIEMPDATRAIVMTILYEDWECGMLRMQTMTADSDAIGDGKTYRIPKKDDGTE